MALHLALFLRACLHGGGGPQVGEVTRLGLQMQITNLHSDSTE